MFVQLPRGLEVMLEMHTREGISGCASAATTAVAARAALRAELDAAARRRAPWPSRSPRSSQSPTPRKSRLHARSAYRPRLTHVPRSEQTRRACRRVPAVPHLLRQAGRAARAASRSGCPLPLQLRRRADGRPLHGLHAQGLPRRDRPRHVRGWPSAPAGAMAAIKMTGEPLPQCQFTVEPAYEGDGPAFDCVNPRFFDAPDEERPGSFDLRDALPERAARTEQFSRGAVALGAILPWGAAVASVRTASPCAQPLLLPFARLAAPPPEPSTPPRGDRSARGR